MFLYRIYPILIAVDIGNDERMIPFSRDTYDNDSSLAIFVKFVKYAFFDDTLSKYSVSSRDKPRSEKYCIVELGGIYAITPPVSIL